jgi:transketolase
MAAIMTGMALHGGILPFGAAFLAEVAKETLVRIK